MIVDAPFSRLRSPVSYVSKYLRILVQPRYVTCNLIYNFSEIKILIIHVFALFLPLSVSLSNQVPSRLMIHLLVVG
jgi:hypothetical protein